MSRWSSITVLCCLTGFVCALGAAASAAREAPASPHADIEARILAYEYATAESMAVERLDALDAAGDSVSTSAADLLDFIVRARYRTPGVHDPVTVEAAERAVHVREKVQGPDHPDLGASLDYLAWVRLLTGDYEGALHDAEHSLAVRERAFGPVHLDVARVLFLLAGLDARLGDPAAAAARLERVVDIRSELLGPEHPLVGKALAARGGYLAVQGRYGEARELYERALTIQEAADGPDHERVADILNKMANLEMAVGDLVKARDLLERAAPITPTVRRPHVLNSLGLAYWYGGDLERALATFEEALEIRVETEGPDHPDLAVAWTNVANVLLDLDRTEEALSAYERAHEIRVAVLDPDHPNLASSWHNLAVAHFEAGDLPRALACETQALPIYEASLGADHPDLANCHAQMAKIALLTGDLASATAHARQAVEILETAYGTSHRELPVVETLYAHVLARGAHPESALDASLHAQAITRENIRATAGRMSQEEALLRQARENGALGPALAALAASSSRSHRPPDTGPVERVWDEVVRSRSLVLDAMVHRNRQVRESSSPELASASGALQEAARELAEHVVRGADGELATYESRLAELADRRNRMEREVARLSRSFERSLRERDAGLAEIAGAIPEGDALVAYVRYRALVDSLPSDSWNGAFTARYLAFVNDTAGRVHVRPLGDAATIDSLVAVWRQEVSFRGTGSPLPGAREAAYREAAEPLRQRVWDPLVPLVAGAGRVFVVPDGSLHVVDLATLPTDDGYLIEGASTFHTLTTERDLLCCNGADDGRRGGLFALGNPDFDAPGAALLARVDGETNPSPGASDGLPFRGPSSTCEELKSLRFTPLSASAEEVRDIARLWRRALETREVAPDAPIDIVTGPDAREELFKARAGDGYRIIHVATHGFFLGDACPSSAGSGLSLGDSPLAHAGLGLAGANLRGANDGAVDDGILTAEEIGTLALDGVEWVVLSACDTGLGRNQSGEGVLGLRRAFQIAGAGSVIMSLWPVRDDLTRSWMQALYRARLMDGRSTAAAVRDAGRSLLESRRERGASTHPFYWAGFVASGGWR